MGIKGIIFLAVAFVGLILNFSARKVSEKVNLSELKIKIMALIIVIISISLLFIFGK